MTFLRSKFVSVAIVLTLVCLVKAQDSDPLEQARQAAKLNASKLKAELQANFRDADRLQRSNPEKARELLRRNRLMLEDDAATLPERERKNYMDEIELKLFRMNDRANSQKRAEDISILKNAEIRAFVAKEKAAADRALLIGNPPVSKVIAGAQNMVKAQALAQIAYQQQMMKYMQDMAKNSNPYYTPPKTDKMVIPAGDINIMKALNSTMKAPFKGEPMDVVLEYLDAKSFGKLNIVVDELGMKQANVDPALFLKDPVNLSFRQALKVRVILKMLLTPRGMDYYIEDGVLYVTKDKKAEQKMVVKMYPVDNLIGATGMPGKTLVQYAVMELQSAARNTPPGQQPQMGPYGQLLSQNIDGLTGQLMGAVEPDSWYIKGVTAPEINPSSKGSMVFVPSTSSLQIRASAEVHYLLLASGMLENVLKK